MPVDRKNSFADLTFSKQDDDIYDKAKFRPDLVFVIMAIRGRRDVYDAIRGECSKLRLEAVRVDDNVGSDFVIREVYNLIQTAEFIICDLTRERPNIYYELGYAHGVGNLPLNILLIAKEGTRLHFDIAPLRVQYYETTEHLRAIIRTNLKTMMERTRKPKKRRKSSKKSSKRRRK